MAKYNNEYLNYDPYGTYQSKGEEDPYSILMKMSSWNKEIRSTISDVQYELGGTIERQSQIIQDIDSINLNVLEINRLGSETRTRVGNLEVRADGIDLTVKDIYESPDGLNARVGGLEIRADSIDVYVAAVDSRLGTAEGRITTMAGQIDLKASSSSVTALGTRMNSAEISINGLNSTITQKVSYTDYNGSTIVSLIHQAPSYITIAANRINLVGAVSVLSDITGRLGSITAGTINGVNINSAYVDIYESIYVGNGVYLRGGRTGFYFGDDSQLFSQYGNMTIEAWNALDIVGSPIRLYGTVDFSRASVIGLDTGGGGTTVRYSETSRRLYVDLNGTQQGWINLDG